MVDRQEEVMARLHRQDMLVNVGTTALSPNEAASKHAPAIVYELGFMASRVNAGYAPTAHWLIDQVDRHGVWATISTPLDRQVEETAANAIQEYMIGELV